jgi:hypothetical protein
MKQPIRITVDPVCSHTYVEYQNSDKEDGWLQLLREPDGSIVEIGRDDPRQDEPLGVLVFVDKDDDVVAIEIITIDEPELIAIARDFAADNGLAFPSDIRAAASAGDPAA